MSTVRRKSRQRVAPIPDTLAQYWAGDPPPDDRAATAEDHELVIEATFFAWAEGAKPAHVTWDHHPHAAAWFAWIKPAAP